MTEADKFATTMQRLSVEAGKTSAVSEQSHASTEEAAISQLAQDLRALNTRFESLGRLLSRRIDNLATVAAGPIQPDLSDHLRLIEDRLAELVSRDCTTQKVFDSLHAELRNYRDNFIRDVLQRPFIHDLVLLFDDLTGLAKQLDTAADEQERRGQVARWRDNLQNAIHSLMEILHRFDVKEVETKEMFDRDIHRVVCYEPAGCEQEDGQVVARVRRGFIWRGKLIRPEEVIVKKLG